LKFPQVRNFCFASLEMIFRDRFDFLAGMPLSIHQP